MTRDTVSLLLESREILGKKVKRLRRAGVIPVHLYGPGIKPRALQCPQRELVRALARAGANTTIVLKIQGDGDEQLALAREIQWDPVRGDIWHVDFLAVEATRRVSAQVPIVLTGQSPGARDSGRSVVQQLRHLDVTALPLEIPSQVEVDLATLVEPDGVIRVRDISPLPNVAILTDPDAVVARVEVPRVVVEEAPAVEEAEGEVEATEEAGSEDGEGRR
jgi:large subunit ribosomal protein L25